MKKQTNLPFLGFLSAAVVSIYSALVGGFIFYISQTSLQPGYLGIFLMLILFVFSAAVTGTLVFGLPAYLALNKKIKEALTLLGYTLIFSLLVILVTIVAIFSIYD